MKIYINYNNKKKSINTINYQSNLSIINQYLEENNMKDDYQNFFLDYNGLHLDNHLSLEKYSIECGFILNLNKKNKGGKEKHKNHKSHHSSSKHLFIYYIIAFLPVFILPLGFISITSSLMTSILKKSFNSIGKYLICTLGKITIMRRVNFILLFFKYIAYFLMVYVIITLPLIILCVVIKGHSILEDPKKLCKPLGVGSMVGLVLTAIFIIIYALHRSSNYVTNFFLSIFKQNYILNLVLTPLFRGFQQLFNEIKYYPAIFFTFGKIKIYFAALDSFVNGIEVFLTTIRDIGCNSSSTINYNFSKPLNKELINIKNNNVHEKNNKVLPIKSGGGGAMNNNNTFAFTYDEAICNDSEHNCCNPDNFINIADQLYSLSTTGISSETIKGQGLFPAFMLMIEGLYESAMSKISLYNDLSFKHIDDRDIFLKNLINTDKGKIPKETVNLIQNYLELPDQNILAEIQVKLDNLYKINKNTIDDIKSKIKKAEDSVVQYAKARQSKYTFGNTLFKSLFKNIFINMFCNLSITSRTGINIITDLGEINEIVDMLKASASTGAILSFIYFITYIVIIICGFFNIF
jgi:hypothetical protein